MADALVDEQLRSTGEECWHGVHEDDGPYLVPQAPPIDEPNIGPGIAIDGRHLVVGLRCRACGAELAARTRLTHADRGDCRALTGNREPCSNGARFESVHGLCGLHMGADAVRLQEAGDE